MLGLVFYVVAAAIVAVAAFLLSEWVREPGTQAAERPGLIAVLAGLLWPVMAIGLAQGTVVAAAHANWWRH